MSTSSVVSNSSLPSSFFIPKYPPRPIPLVDMTISLPRLLSFTSPRQTVAILSSFSRWRQQFEVRTTTILVWLEGWNSSFWTLFVVFELASACLDQQSMQFWLFSKKDLVVLHTASLRKRMNSLFICMVEMKMVFWRQLLKSPRMAYSLSSECSNLWLFCAISQSSLGIQLSRRVASYRLACLSASSSSAFSILRARISLQSQQFMQALEQSTSASWMSLVICTSSFENMLIMQVISFPLNYVMSRRQAFSLWIRYFIYRYLSLARKGLWDRILSGTNLPSAFQISLRRRHLIISSISSSIRSITHMISSSMYLSLFSRFYLTKQAKGYSFSKWRANLSEYPKFDQEIKSFFPCDQSFLCSSCP